MIYRIGHIILALLFFVSSTGLVLNKHYCQDELKSMAFFVEAKPCHENKATASCPMHAAMDHQGDQEKKGCCDDETEYVKSESEQFAENTEVGLSGHPALKSAGPLPFQLDRPIIDHQSLHYLNYKPPLIVCDFAVSLQTFLC